ncbi:hypothetical protein [Streptomyces sp. SID12488]|uniref:hypothetical protein n=1 Tax=Streptomyces sp. SID12488 TaxID=2706040 RepID=UPI0013DC14EF|nr:hypothetical protein [Streptomyces sp. SID12488]NEA61361.1 hypothetical protein [Streptomyces sp. SID12488]
MKIRMTQAMPEGAQLNGAPWPAEGEEADVQTAQGAHLVASGVAEEVVDEAAGDGGPPGKEPRPRTRRKIAAAAEEE